jgi:hypothetical protein
LPVTHVSLAQVFTELNAAASSWVVWGWLRRRWLGSAPDRDSFFGSEKNFLKIRLDRKTDNNVNNMKFNMLVLLCVFWVKSATGLSLFVFAGYASDPYQQSEIQSDDQ